MSDCGIFSTIFVCLIPLSFNVWVFCITSVSVFIPILVVLICLIMIPFQPRRGNKDLETF